ncbi:MAG: hypothetical protein LBB47_02170, partial [Spirochaetaceae bacterium]|nr:hypothetical protein [Spirochaetaceae bacterium]
MNDRYYNLVNKYALKYGTLLIKAVISNSPSDSWAISCMPADTSCSPVRFMSEAAALRQSGRGVGLSLFSVQEPFVKGGLPGVICLMLHCYMEEHAV